MIDVAIDIVTETTSDDAAPNARSWKVFVELINSTWRKGAADYLACGCYLIEAKAELMQRDAYSAMLKKLHFEPSVAKKLVCIAKTAPLSSHVNCLPPCYTTLYCLSQLPDAVLEAAFADGRIHPGMMRKDANALKPAKETAPKKAETSASAPVELNAAWEAASAEQRRALFDRLGREGLCAAMSAALAAELRDRILNLNARGAFESTDFATGASESTDFATYSTNKFHSVLACAETPTDENLKRIVALLGCITKMADAKGISRSAVIIAESQKISRTTRGNRSKPGRAANGKTGRAGA